MKKTLPLFAFLIITCRPAPISVFTAETSKTHEQILEDLRLPKYFKAPDELLTLPADVKMPEDLELTDYRWPVPEGPPTSVWCECRKGGSSPHIGKDFKTNENPNKQSIATNNGIVISAARAINPNCGYVVWLVDAGGALWRYVHLDKPKLKAGDVLSAGDVVGVHTMYPNTASKKNRSCGLGQHLHLDRYTAGKFKDEEKFRTCQKGEQSCNYNPDHAKDPEKLSGSTSLSLTVEHDSHDFVKEEVYQYENSQQAPESVCSAYQPAPERVEALPVASNSEVSLSVDFKTSAAVSGEKILNVQIWLKKSSGDNKENNCGLNNSQECIISWNVLTSSDEKNWNLIYEDESVRNVDVWLDWQTSYCSKDNQYTIVANTNKGNTVISKGAF